ncbi:hypothetical protein V1T76_06730 [Roseibium sp. FZY0029]|nr:hypothetical protein [Roseibium sp. FZY0029]
MIQSQAVTDLSLQPVAERSVAGIDAGFIADTAGGYLGFASATLSVA